METPDTRAPALLLRGVRKTFEATDEDQIPVRALRGIDLEVGPGAFVAIMGPSGCGKSTLLNLVAGLDAPSDGEIDIAGEPIAGLSDDDLAVMRRRHIGIVFQFFNLLEGMTVRENVALPAVVAGRSRSAAESRAMDLLDLLGIADKATSSPGVLARDGSIALCTGRVNVTAQVTTAAPPATTQNGASRASRAPVPSIDAPCAA